MGKPCSWKAVLLRLQQPRQAAPFYERVTETNPSCLRAWIGLAETLLSADRATNAVQAIPKDTDHNNPTNPQLLLREAQYRYKVGEREESRQMLEQWLQQNRGPALPRVAISWAKCDNQRSDAGRPESCACHGIRRTHARVATGGLHDG